MSPTIFHITTREEADAAARAGSYAPRAFADEGFIHCSYPDQIREVANRLFLGRADLMLFEIDPQRLSCNVIAENLEGGKELFPHVYGRLPMAAVMRVVAFPCASDGRFELPESLGPSS